MEYILIDDERHETESHDGLLAAASALEAAGLDRAPILRDGEPTGLLLFASPTPLSTTEVARTAWPHPPAGSPDV